MKSKHVKTLHLQYRNVGGKQSKHNQNTLKHRIFINVTQAAYETNTFKIRQDTASSSHLKHNKSRK